MIFVRWFSLVVLFFVVSFGEVGAAVDSKRERKIRETFQCADHELGKLRDNFDLWKQSGYSYYLPVVYKGKEEDKYFSSILYERVMKLVGEYKWMILSVRQNSGEYSFIFFKDGNLIFVEPYINITKPNCRLGSRKEFRDWIWYSVNDTIKAEESERKWNDFKKIKFLWKKNWFEECQLKMIEKKPPQQVYKKLDDVMTFFKEHGKVELKGSLSMESWKDMCYFSYRVDFEDSPEFPEAKLLFFGSNSRIFGYLPPGDERALFYPCDSWLGSFNSLFFDLFTRIYNERDNESWGGISESCDYILKSFKQNKRGIHEPLN